MGAIRCCYEIHSLKQRLADVKMRVEVQTRRTGNVKREVESLRKEISQLKVKERKRRKSIFERPHGLNVNCTCALCSGDGVHTHNRDPNEQD